MAKRQISATAKASTLHDGFEAWHTRTGAPGLISNHENSGQEQIAMTRAPDGVKQ